MMFLSKRCRSLLVSALSDSWRAAHRRFSADLRFDWASYNNMKSFRLNTEMNKRKLWSVNITCTRATLYSQSPLTSKDSDCFTSIAVFFAGISRFVLLVQ